MHLRHRPLAAALLAAAIVFSTARISRAADAVDPLRLTREVEPLAEAVELNLNPATDDFSGRVRVDVVVNRPVTTFRLNALGPVLTSASLTDLSGRALPGPSPRRTTASSR
jgi:hypothetical protein